jgi:hypothetical protein
MATAKATRGLEQHQLWIFFAVWIVGSVITVRYLERHKTHILQSARAEMWIGVGMYAIASVLLWDAFIQRGDSAPWPLGVVTPF